jgi:hypothetical protein
MGDNNVAPFAALGKPGPLTNRLPYGRSLPACCVGVLTMDAVLELALGALLLGTLIVTPVLMLMGQL